MSATGMRLPDFIIAGAPRSGTTWLYQLLSRHPGIFMARPVVPEPKFFLVDDLYQRGLTYYSQTWFADARPDQVAGEKSANYLESPAVPGRIAAALPGVKLVFILREPAARCYSNYLWSRKNGLEHEDFETALALEEQREATVAPRWRFARPHAYFSRGVYHELLRRWFEVFDRDQILCLRHEDIRERPADLAERLHRFLGVEPRPQDGTGLGRINESEPAAPPMPAHIRQELRARYAEPNRRLAELLGPEFPVWGEAA
jgi:hypothetical protein